MWACVQDQDTAGQWKQVAGWRKVCDLALAHLSRLREYRRGLAEAWPPETNTAARAYIGELDQLIDRVQRTHDAAAANYDALAAAARAIGSARAELQPLHEEYAKKLRQKQAYEATIADPKAVAGSRLPERPPVTDDDLEQLNVRARGLMTGLSGELQHAQVMLQRPPAVPRPGIETNNPDVYGASGAAPVIPPIVPVAATSPRPRSKPLPLSGVSSQRPPTPPTVGVGPILGSAGSTLTPSPSTATPNVPSTPPSLPSSVPLPPAAPGANPSLRDARPHPFTGRAVSGEVPKNALPRTQPNGLIGQPFGPGLVQPSSPNATPRRVNPVGGVIGGGGAGTAPAGNAGSRPGGIGRSSVMGPMGGSPLGGYPTSSGRSGRQDETSRVSRPWDPDHPWETDKGVNPVVLPPTDDGPIDPGPAIGRDR
ncbi:hypothetical protein GA0070562_1965 [Micromonospora tulbaghiae]|uniref:PPE family domain-containing protein n=2 Tax=Micromonospora tulbaghiae TaxID=479978 RepID=A0ABY0KH01_9ACTN|nr:hypothetical protein GA0070562_1965 [Micromonospora tulbaghiae]